MSATVQMGLFDDEFKDDLSIKIESFLISDYLLVCKLLDDVWLCSSTSHKILSTRMPNHISNIRKILGLKSILNIIVPTTSSYYERYKINEAYRHKFIELKAVYEANKTFMDKVYLRLELVKKG